MRSSRRLKHELNVVPYIDVMLVLLVIFMVTAPLISQGNIDLPSVSTASSKNDNNLEIQLEKGNKYNIIDKTKHLNNNNLSEESLISTLKSIDKNRAIVIAANKELNYGEVMATLDKIKKIGFNKIGLLVYKN